jgi:hypothetical protein
MKALAIRRYKAPMEIDAKVRDGAPVSSSYELIVVPNWLREFRERMARR